MAKVISQLSPIAFRLLLLRIAGWIGICILGTGVAFGILELLEQAFVFKELTAFFLNVLILVMAGLVTIAGLVRCARTQPRMADLANKVEEAHPDLMDSLNAAVEVVRIPKNKRSIIENLLLE
ncbi:MAG: hypothetical protein KJT03_08945, partial [Verrucomicrobiae bacterium]|nr:hypothetical protein [Verrucomicrobiae bacterium]